ncbi:glideosome-associated protein 50 [Plasmodium brasilianum]|uniref:Glideosome-associated protein 50, putative n=2 Tax=Plasmodium (Plasmodium) TaxID=418103 RepID=A0A1A8WZJ4_PLAMA|nr:glideosome-associated protein 50, putative [Plasmodium malariae]KAI4839415.1 glideosome-associated protein 50 [Plasmodium brasilianum]SBS97743.1 glideosome-associated protein 50, putative (GAP50) [Plasmodium malariae]SBT87834.1 glideosome-associated protein 50, putative [Plasmodium malariae]
MNFCKTVFNVFFVLFFISSYTVKCQLRFASLGDWGKESKSQLLNAKYLKQYIKNERVTFIVSPGSNFLDGVRGMNDPAWKSLYEDVYAEEKGDMYMPFFTVLGTRDWAGNYNAQVLKGQGIYVQKEGETTIEREEDKTDYPKWIMPNYWYHYFTHFTVSSGPSIVKTGHKDMAAAFLFIDTWILSGNFPYRNIHEKAWEDLKLQLNVAKKIADFIIVVGDQPIYSSGLSRGNSYLAYYLLPLLKDAQVDLYIAGHDNNMEVIEDNSMAHITCGSGAISNGKSALKSSKSLFFSSDIGFCIHELTYNGILTKFVSSKTGDVIYTHKVDIKKKKTLDKVNSLQYFASLPKVQLTDVPASGPMGNKDTFVRIVGTIGILIGSVIVFMGVSSFLSKSMK